LILDMPKKNPPYLYQHRSGKWCVRKDRNGPRAWLSAAYGSATFWNQYRDALAGTTIERQEKDDIRFSLAWAIDQYMNSHEWAGVASETRKQFSYQYAKMRDASGDLMLSEITQGDILEGRSKRAHKPSDANKFLISTRKLYQFAISHKWVKSDPTAGIPKLVTSATGEGFITWPLDWFKAFEAKWPVGSMQRLAYEIMCGTGIRRADVRRFGPQHIRNGQYEIRPNKTKAHGMIVSGDVEVRLSHAINSTQHGDFVYLLTSHGKPFKSDAAFGNWFGDACRAAGVPGSAHGIRKGLAALAAENGTSNAELNSFFGWSHRSKESAVYIDKANRGTMSRSVGKLLHMTLSSVEQG
jgi:integrase